MAGRRELSAGPMKPAIGLILAALLASATVPVQRVTGPFSDYTTEIPGALHQISAEDLPPPFATASAENTVYVVPRPALAWPKAPSGFFVEQFASGLEGPRLIRTAPNGDLFVVESVAGRVRVLRTQGPGSRPRVETFASGLNYPFGIAFYPPGPSPKYIYVASNDSVVRFPYENGDVNAQGNFQVVVPSLPPGGHPTRDIAFTRDGRTMYVSVGSYSNADDTDNNLIEANRAAILETTPDGTSPLRVYASGIRNPVQIAVAPFFDELWASVNERDGLGDNLPPDYVTRVSRGGFYGWPWYYIGGHQDPRHIGRHPELKGQVIVPDVLLQPHHASLGFTFYDGEQFPVDYEGDIFAAQHGSWNRRVATGYSVIRVRLAFGRPVGSYEDFLTGFITSEGQVWGRPVSVAVASDGSLMVSDDGSNSIWRVWHRSGRYRPEP